MKKYITSLLLFFFFVYALNGYTQAIVYAVEEGKKISNQNTTSATVEKKTQKKKHALTTSVQQKVKKYQHTTLTELQIPGDGKKSKKFLAKISKDTEFRAANGSDIFPGDISLEEGTERFVGGQSFEFGISGTHLVFSKPIQMEMEVTAPEGSMYEILVKHEGDIKYNTSGLSVISGGNCDSTGNHSNPGNYSKVKNGKVIFYTCGASRYIMNPTGGGSGTNDVRWIIGDYGQVQVYYNGLSQIYVGDPPVTGAGGPSVWPRLRIGTLNIGNGGTAWTTSNTTSSQVGNTYYTTNTLTYDTGGRTYTLELNWEYTAPEKFLTWSYNITVPSGNTDNIKFYYGQDSYVAGGDGNDVGYYTTVPTQTVGIFDNAANVLSAQRYISGETWDGYIATAYGTVQTQTNGGGNYTNVITGTAGDLGYGINWDLGTTPGSYSSTTEWRVLPYVSASVPDPIPGIAQPNPGLYVGVTSQIPLNVTNAGNASSTGAHTMVLTLPAGVSGPGASFTSNGWSCGAQVGSTVTCSKTMTLASLATDNFTIPVTPGTINENQTLTFSVSLSNASDSNGGNNTASVQMQVAVAPTPNDATPPSIGNHFPTDNMVLPIGNFNFMFQHSDQEGAINTLSHDLVLQKWTGASWGADISGTYLGTTTVNSSGAVYSITNLPYGKYKAAYSISDIIGLSTTQEVTFYVDELEFTINTGSLNIGNLPSGSNHFGSEELTVTIKTVGVPFNLTMNQNSNMIYNVTELIPNWDGTKGFGYELEPYASNISNIGTGALIATQARNINTDGDKNTYTYKIKYGANVDIEQSPGDYSALVSFTIETSYTNPPSICIFDESFFGCNL